MEAELVQRVLEGRMDIGGTFTEPYESTMYNEIMVRQVYMGRKWFIDRYPQLANITAMVAFHQDGPLRALQVGAEAERKNERRRRKREEERKERRADRTKFALFDEPNGTERIFLSSCSFFFFFPSLSLSFSLILFLVLASMQVPQVYRKAGIKYLKASRYSDSIFRWASPDGSSLLTFEEVHYGKLLRLNASNLKTQNAAGLLF